MGALFILFGIKIQLFGGSSRISYLVELLFHGWLHVLSEAAAHACDHYCAGAPVPRHCSRTCCFLCTDRLREFATATGHPICLFQSKWPMNDLKTPQCGSAAARGLSPPRAASPLWVNRQSNYRPPIKRLNIICLFQEE